MAPRLEHLSMHVKVEGSALALINQFYVSLGKAALSTFTVQTDIFTSFCSPNTDAFLSITGYAQSQIRKCIRIKTNISLRHCYEESKVVSLSFAKTLKKRPAMRMMSKMSECHQEGHLFYKKYIYFWRNVF